MVVVNGFWYSGLFFFNNTVTAEIYTLSLHDALPISGRVRCGRRARAERGGEPDHPRADRVAGDAGGARAARRPRRRDRKSTRLNSSHPSISYAVFCLKKKNREGSGKGFYAYDQEESG